MKQYQSNLLRMYGKVGSVFDQFQPLVNSIVGFSAAVQTFKSKVDGIRQFEKLTSLSLVGYTKDKNLHKEKAAYFAAKAAAALRSVSFQHEMPELMQEIDFSERALARMKDEKLIAVIYQVYDRANENIALLAELNIDPAFMNVFFNTIEAFRIAFEKSASVHMGRVAGIKARNSLYKEVNQLLDRNLDNIVILVEKDNPDFSKLYMEARKVLDYHGRPVSKVPLEPSAVLTGFVFDSVTGLPVEFAKVELLNSDLVTETDSDGEWDLEAVKPGDCVIRISADGYATTDFPVVTLAENDEIVSDYLINPIGDSSDNNTPSSE